jgi:hypothetical protein
LRNARSATERVRTSTTTTRMNVCARPRTRRPGSQGPRQCGPRKGFCATSGSNGMEAAASTVPVRTLDASATT